MPNFAPCPHPLTNARVAHRDLLTDLARLDERILRVGHLLNDFDAEPDLEALAHDLAVASRLLGAVITENRDMPTLDEDAEVICGYDDTLDVETTTLYAFATCPRCGTNRRIETDTGTEVY